MKLHTYIAVIILSLISCIQVLGQWLPFGPRHSGVVTSAVLHDSILYMVTANRDNKEGLYKGDLWVLDSIGWHKVFLPENKYPTKLVAANDLLFLFARGMFPGDSAFVFSLDKNRKWKAMGSGLDHYSEARLHDVAFYKNQWVLAGRFSSYEQTHGLAVWRNNDWQILPDVFSFEFFNSTEPEVITLLATDSVLFLGGNFEQIGGNPMMNVACWNGESYQSLGDGLNRAVFSLCAFKGAVYAGGAFNRSGKKRIELLAKYKNGWERAELRFTAGDGRLSFLIRALRLYNDTLVVAGLFNETALDGVIYSATNVLAFDGKNVFNLPGGPNGTVTDALLYDEQLLVAGAFNALGGQPAPGKMGAYLFSLSTTGEASFIDFEIYPDPATTYVGVTFPPNQNIRFIFLMDAAGMVIGSFHPWQRMFYVGHLMSGIYSFQFVDFNHTAHEKSFMIR